MKVIFIEDVPNVAKTGDVKEVADGYVRNYLLPRKLAILAKPSALKNLEADLKIRVRKKAENDAEFAALAQQLEGKEIIIKANAGAKSRLYGSITSTDIAAGLEKAGITIDKRKIGLSKPIHQLGNYEIAIKLSKDFTPKIRVIVAEEEKEEGGKPETATA